MLVLVSYIPLLRGLAGQLLEPEVGARLLDDADDAGHVDAIVWAAGDRGRLTPTFAMRRADAIVDHLIEFAEGTPASWFTLCFDLNDDEYVLALLPNVQKSIDRFFLARSLVTGHDAVREEEIRVIFQPLLFRGPLSDVSRRALRQLGDEVTLGFVDVGALAAGLDQLDPRTPSRIGPLRCKRDPGLLDRS